MKGVTALEEPSSVKKTTGLMGTTANTTGALTEPWAKHFHRVFLYEIQLNCFLLETCNLPSPGDSV